MSLYQLEAGPAEFDLMCRFGELREDQINNRTAVSAALGRLLRRALVALLREDERHHKKM
jgi:hypothetical protein